MIILRLLAGLALLAGSTAVQAITTHFTASFAPSLSNPENNSFTNTTPVSGYCLNFPEECEETGTFSIDIGLKATLITEGIYANASPRDSMYFGMPGAWRDLVVTNSTTGSTATLRFRVSAFAARFYFPDGKGSGTWKGGSFVYAPPPCLYSGVLWGGNRSTQFMWKLPGSASDVACYKIATVDYLGAPTSIESFSIGYELNTPNPLQMQSGEYSGTLNLSVGQGADFDFGNNFAMNDSNVYLNFTLSVNHELNITTTPEDQKVTLQPCAGGKICTEAEGEANWERWMITRITPQLTGRSHFNLSSSGAFTVYLACEQQSGSDCALRSDNAPSQLIPVQTLLTLPENVVDNATGTRISKRRLAVGKELEKNVFVTKTFGQNKRGSIDFLIDQREVDTMLKTRPDTFRGAVTVIFDPKIY